MTGDCYHARHDQCNGCDCACHAAPADPEAFFALFSDEIAASGPAMTAAELAEHSMRSHMASRRAAAPAWAGNLAKQHRPRKA